MTIRLNNISKWAELAPGSLIVLPGTHQRKVRVDVNCAAYTVFHLLTGDGEDKVATFVGAVRGGLETFEFSLPGNAWLGATSEGEVWWFTNEGGEGGVRADPTKKFTTLITPSEQDPRVERMLFRMKLNYERNLQAQAHELERQQQQMAELRASIPAHDLETGEIEDDEEDGAGDDAGGVGSAAAEPDADATGQDANGDAGSGSDGSSLSGRSKPVK